MMPPALFTLDEANRLLPLVRVIVRDAVAAYQQAKRSIDALGWLRSQQASAEDISRQDAVVAGHLEEVKRLVAELESLGCRLRDYDRGAVDFPAASLDTEGFVVYSWELGEDSVAYWRTEHERHQERRLLVQGV